MRTIQELKEFTEKLSKLTGFIAEHGKKDEFEERYFGYACNVQDTIAWVLMEIETTYRHLSYIKIISIAVRIEAN